MLITTLQRIAAAAPPDLLTLALLGVASVLTLVAGFARRGRNFLPDAFALGYVALAATLVWVGPLRVAPLGELLALETLAAALLLAHLIAHRGETAPAPECSTVRAYLGCGVAAAAGILFWQLGSYAGSLLVWEATVIEGFGEAVRAGQSVLGYAATCLLWDNGLLSAGHTSLFYGVPTYALFELIGFSTWTLRFLAVVATLLTIGTAYAVARRCFGEVVGAAAALCFASNWGVLFYGRYGSSPAGTLLAVLLALWALWTFLEHESTAWWAGPVCGVALYAATLEYSPARLVVLLLLGTVPIVLACRWRRIGWRHLVGLVGLVVIVAGVFRLQQQHERAGTFVGARGEQVLNFMNHRDYLREYLGRAVEPERITVFEKIELVTRVLERTVPQYTALVLPRVNPLPPGAVIAIDPPPLPLYYAPLAVFIVWGIGVSVAGWRSWPHALLLVWAVATSVPLLMTTRVDTHRLALLVVPVMLWAALGVREAAGVLTRAGIPTAFQHGLAAALLATMLLADVNLLYFSPERVRSAYPYAFTLARYPVVHQPLAGDIMAQEARNVPGPIAVATDMDVRDRGWTDLALLDRAWRNPNRGGQVLPEGLWHWLEGSEPRPEALDEVAKMARERTVLLAPAATFRRAGMALAERGLRVVQRGGPALDLLRIDAGAAATRIPDEELRGWTTAAVHPTPSGPEQRVALTDLKPTTVEYGFAPPQIDRSWDGGRIVMDNVGYGRGLGVHAWTRMTYPVPAGAATLRAVVGLADDVRECDLAAVTFTVEDAAGRVLFDSGIIKSADPPRAISVALGTAREVTLVVTEGGNGRDCDHANWAEPEFVESAGSQRVGPAGTP